MSHGRCDEVLRLLWQFMDRELDRPTYERVEEHFRRCQPCQDLHEFEVRLREIIRMKCTGEAAPETLRRRLRQLLADL